MSKKIDWSKPIRWAEGYRAPNDQERGLKVVFSQHGETVVAWNTGMEIVDSQGQRRGTPFIENTPEELYLRLCRGDDGVWRLDGAGEGKGPSRWEKYEGKQALPLDMWERYYADRVKDENHILVKVPA